MWSSSLICGLVLLPREIRVVPPPWIIYVLKYGPLDCFQKSLKAFTCCISKNTVIDGQFCAWCMGLAQTKQLSTGNVLAALMGNPTLRASSLLTTTSIFKFNSVLPFNSWMPHFLGFQADLSQQLVKSHSCELSTNLSKAL
jgi:hypothetical protein